MQPETLASIIIAIVSFAGSLIGTFTAIYKAGQLTNYRIEKLEDKVGHHNNLEGRIIVLETDQKTIKTDIESLEKTVYAK